MKKSFLAVIAFVLFCSHDMYLKLDTYFLKPDTSATIKLYNGTFDKSENVIDRDRMIDASLVGNGNRHKINPNQWSEKDSITFLNLRTGESGTWVAGVSTAAKTLELSATDFNEYLEHDGATDMLDWRRENDALNVDAVEKYSKHVKAIFQVGNKKSNDWQTILGYPIEFIPLSNPYDLNTGDELEVKLIYKGEPLADQLVYADYEVTGHGHSHEEGTEHGHSHNNENGKTEENHQHTSGAKLRTDANGILTVKLLADGLWYLRTINLVHSEAPELTHESNWATLTFEVVHGHEEPSHNHADGHEEGIPSYAYWIASFILLSGLFLWFNRKR